MRYFRYRRAARHPAFKWVNTVLANIKTSIVGTYKAVRKKHMVRTLAEVEWRFNNRRHGPRPRLRRRSRQTGPLLVAQDG